MKKRMNKKDWFETHIEVISLSGTKKEDKKTFRKSNCNN